MTDLKAAVERVRLGLNTAENHREGYATMQMRPADLRLLLAALEAGQWRPIDKLGDDEKNASQPVALKERGEDGNIVVWRYGESEAWGPGWFSANYEHNRFEDDDELLAVKFESFFPLPPATEG